MLTAAIPVNGL